MGKCIKFKNLKFRSEEEFESYLMSQFLGVRFKRVVDAKTVSDEIDQLRDRIHFDEKEHIYTFNDIKFISTTTLINEGIVGLNEIHNTPKGEASRKIGQRYHDIFETVIKGRNAGMSLNEIIKKNPSLFTQTELNDLGEKVNSLYNEWTTTDGKPNGNIVKSEFRIGNTENKVAGTIDIGVIHPDGSLDLYDIKGSRYRYGEYSQKLDANAAQLEIYKTMLEMGDANIGAKSYKVNKTVIIPFESKIEESENGDFIGNNEDEKFKLTGIKFEGFHDTNDKSFFKNKDKMKSIIFSMFNPDNGIKVDSLKMEDAPTSENFSSKISGFDFGEEPYDPQEFGDRTDIGLAHKFVRAFHENYKIFSEPKDSNMKQGAQVVSFFNRFDPKSDKMVVANSFPGFENVDPNILFIMKNFDPDTASFTYLDMAYIDLNMDNSSQDIDNAHRTIFNQFASDRKVKSIARKIGADGLELYYNNSHSNRAMVMGMLALKMIKLNPDIKIGTMYVDSFPTFKDGKHTIHSMDKVIDHMKMMEQIKDENGEPLIKRLPEDIQDILKDPYFRDTKNYAHNYLENLFHYIMSGLKTTEEDVTPGLVKWYEMNLKDMVPNGSNSKQLREISDDILKSFRKKKELLKYLRVRMDEIKRLQPTLRNSEDSYKMNYRLSKEYDMLSDLTVYLYDLIPSIDRITEDMTSFEKYTSTGGLTGVEIIDKFADEVQIANGLLSRDLYANYIVPKKEQFKKLFGQEFIEKLGDKALGLTSKYFEPLLEEREFKLKNGGGRTVMRKTMRFWPKDSEQYKKLSTKQKEFIEWYSDKIDEYMKASLPSQDLNIRDYWVRGDIPLVKGSNSNIIYKAMERKVNDKEGGYKNLAKTLLTRTTARFKDRTGMDYHGDKEDKENPLEEVNTFFRKQVNGKVNKKAIKEGFPFAKASRMRQLGIDKEGFADETRMDDWDTNLEMVLNFAAVGAKSKEHLEHLIPLYYAVKNIVDRAEGMHNKNFKNMREYLEVYSMNILKHIRQKTFKSDAMEAFISVTSSKAGQAVVAWNPFSQLKNFIATHIHQMSNTAARLGGGEWSSIKDNHKALTYVWKNIFNGGFKMNSKMYELMYSLGLSNIDAENILRDKRFQEGGQYATSSRWGNIGTSAGDFYGRSWISIAQMVKDGTWHAWEIDPKTGHYKYNEDLDPRFKGENGEAFKKFLKSEMEGENTLDENGRMISPYTQRKIESIRKLSSMTYETRNTGAEPIMNNWVLARVATMLNGWAVSKRERYYKAGKKYDIIGDYVPKTDADGNLTGDFKWDGQYLEGMIQSISHVSKSAWDHVVGNEKGGLNGFMKELTPMQKQNLSRMFFELGVGTVLGMLLTHWLFGDKKKKKSLSYYLALGSLSEVSTLNHISSGYSLLTSPFPAIGIYRNTLNGLFSSDPERIFSNAIKFAGPPKLIYYGQKIADEPKKLGY